LHGSVPTFFLLLVFCALKGVTRILFLNHPVEHKIILIAHSIE
jgi:hypothetical protein